MLDSDFGLTTILIHQPPLDNGAILSGTAMFSLITSQSMNTSLAPVHSLHTNPPINTVTVHRANNVYIFFHVHDVGKSEILYLSWVLNVNEKGALDTTC